MVMTSHSLMEQFLVFRVDKRDLDNGMHLLEVKYKFTYDFDGATFDQTAD